jgi:hypothetical protein
MWSSQVANDGTIPFRAGAFKERVQLNYYFTQRFANQSVELVVSSVQSSSVEFTYFIRSLLCFLALMRGDLSYI